MGAPERRSRRPARPALVRGLLALLASVALATAVTACGGAGSSTAPGGVSSTPAAATARPTAPDLTPVPAITPGSGSATPKPGTATTRTDWGTILDAVPAGFPVFPGAEPADAVDGPVSGAWISDAPVDEVATWYRTALAAAGFGKLDLSSALEDGSRVLDAASAATPGCQVQATFRPQGGSTMITVLYGAGCAGGAG